MRDEGNAQEGQDFTLSGRIGRIEKYLNLDASGGLKEAMQAEAEAAWQRSMIDQVGRHTEQAQVNPSTLTAFEDITERIRSSAERIHDQAHKLEVIGTRILGPLPNDDTGKNAAVANPECTLDHTYLALNVLDSALGRLHSAALRLERL